MPTRTIASVIDVVITGRLMQRSESDMAQRSPIGLGPSTGSFSKSGLNTQCASGASRKFPGVEEFPCHREGIKLKGLQYLRICRGGPCVSPRQHNPFNCNEGWYS